MAEGWPEHSLRRALDPSVWTAAIKTSLRQKFGGVRFGERPSFALVEAVGKKIIVKINDVGPLTPGRIIDLNERAMRYFDPSLQLGVIYSVIVRPLFGDYWIPARLAEHRTCKKQSTALVDSGNASPTSEFRRMSARRHELPLPANGCARARSLSNGLISRNSRSARSASASSTGRSCRHCSDRRKSQAGRNSASRRRTRNNVGLDRYTKGAGCGSPCAKPKLSRRKLEGCYSVADEARQDTVSVPAWRRPFVSRLS